MLQIHAVDSFRAPFRGFVFLNSIQQEATRGYFSGRGTFIELNFELNFKLISNLPGRKRFLQSRETVITVEHCIWNAPHAT